MALYSRYAIPTVNFAEVAHRFNFHPENPNFAHSIFGHVHTFSAL